MRKGTQAFISVLSLGVIAAGYQAGQAVEINNFASAVAPSGAASSGAASSAAAPSAAASATESAAPAVDTAPSAAPATATSPAPKSTAVAPAPAATPKATVAASAPKVTTPAASTSVGTTKDGSAVPYRFGTVQVSVTKSGGKITAVNLLQSGATGGREAAFSYLVDLAIQANGTSFGNLSGATYTVDAFKQSMEAALAKF